MSDDDLRKLQRDLGTVEDDDLRERRDNVNARLEQYLERAEEERHGLGTEIAEELLEIENAVKDRYPGLVSSLRAAARIMSNAGV